MTDAAPTVRRSRARTLAVKAMLATAAGAALVTASGVWAAGLSPADLSLDGLGSCAPDLGCGHGFGCLCNLLPPPGTAH